MLQTLNLRNLSHWVLPSKKENGEINLTCKKKNNIFVDKRKPKKEDVAHKLAMKFGVYRFTLGLVVWSQQQNLWLLLLKTEHFLGYNFHLILQFSLVWLARCESLRTSEKSCRKNLLRRDHGVWIWLMTQTIESLQRIVCLPFLDGFNSSKLLLE